MLPFLLVGAERLVAGLAGVGHFLEGGLPILARGLESLGQRIGGGFRVMGIAP